MDFMTAPAIRKAVEQRAAHGVFGYEHVDSGYYEAVCNWFGRRHQWTIEPAWILYTTGVVPAVSACIKALTRPGDGVIIMTPVYNCFFSSIRNNGCRIVENRLLNDGGRYTIDFDDLEAKASDEGNKAILLCNPHNPVGRRWTREELARVYIIGKEYGLAVISDEIHNELTFNNERYQPFATCHPQAMDISVICTSPSKSFNTAGLQTANIICSNDAWRRRIDRAININEVCDLNPFGPAALKAAYNDSEDWLDELCDYLWQNYLMLRNHFAQHLPQLRVTPLEATYLAWVDISALQTDADTLCERLVREARVRLSPGTMYDSEGGRQFVRINLACPRPMLREALQRITNVIR